MKSVDGYTMIEIIIAISVIGILSGIAVLAGGSSLAQGRDAQRVSNVQAIARAFETYYRLGNSSTGASYPTTTQVTSSPTSVLNGANATILQSPNSTANSLSSATNNTSHKTDTNYPTSADSYVYQPLTSSGAICSTAPCVRFVLYYRRETSLTTLYIDSLHQQ